MLTFLANYDCVIFTINSSILPSVVGILGGKTGRGISTKINRLSKFEQRNVVGVRLRALIVLVHDRVHLQLHVLPGHDGENEAAQCLRLDYYLPFRVVSVAVAAEVKLAEYDRKIVFGRSSSFPEIVLSQKAIA